MASSGFRHAVRPSSEGRLWLGCLLVVCSACGASSTASPIDANNPGAAAAGGVSGNMLPGSTGGTNAATTASTGGQGAGGATPSSPIDAGMLSDPASIPGDAGTDAHVSMGACDNAHDQPLLDATDFDAKTNQCGMDCQVLGALGCTRDCVVRQTGISAACATCYDTLVGCAAQKCWDMCIFAPDSPTCDACVTGMCRGAFDTCSGAP